MTELHGDCTADSLCTCPDCIEGRPFDEEPVLPTLDDDPFDLNEWLAGTDWEL
jgi:hypothetical protein